MAGATDMKRFEQTGDQGNKDNYGSGQNESPHNETYYYDEHGNRHVRCILPYPESPYQQPSPRQSEQKTMINNCRRCGSLNSLSALVCRQCECRH
jgi:ribosomal protein L40E